MLFRAQAALCSAACWRLSSVSLHPGRFDGVWI